MTALKKDLAERATRQAEVETLGARPADVCLDARRAVRLLETELLGVALGVRRAVR